MWQSCTEQRGDTYTQNNFSPAIYIKVQEPQLTDYLPRRTFWESLLRKCTRNPAFLSLVLFIDEVGFARDGRINFCNKKHDKKSHRNLHTGHLRRFSLNESLCLFVSVINQLDAQNFCFTISLFHSCTCFKHMCSKHVQAWNKLIVKQNFVHQVG